MTKALLWAACCLITFSTFLWVTSASKPDPAKNLSQSQPIVPRESKAFTKISSDENDGNRHDTKQRSTVHADEVTMSSKEPEPLPEKTPDAGRETAFPVQKFAIDEILAMPRVEQNRFLTKNQIQDPEKFARFRNISQMAVIDRYLKGQFAGTIEGSAGEAVKMKLDIDGQVEQDHFQGEIAVELLDKRDQPLTRSHLRGPLDDHIRMVEEGDRSSLLIQPSGPESPRMYQVFIGSQNRQQLAGNYYARNGEGKLQILGSFVLKRL